MTHFRVDIQLPIFYNPVKGETRRKKIPKMKFLEAYEKFLEIADGVSTSYVPIFGSWIHPQTKIRYDDKSVLFSVIVESEDKMTVNNITKIKKLKKYKKILKKEFEQKEILMVATRCTWL